MPRTDAERRQHQDDICPRRRATDSRRVAQIPVDAAFLDLETVAREIEAQVTDESLA